MFAFLLSPFGKILGGVAIVAAALLGFRIWLASHDAGVLSGYVLQSEVAAAQAEADEMEQQRDDAEQALDEAEKRRAADARNAEATDARTQAELDDYVSKHPAAPACTGAGRLSSDDAAFILRH